MMSLLGLDLCISIPRAPWPGAGKQVSIGNTNLSSLVMFKRFNPASAKTSASKSPSSNFFNLVPTLPLTFLISKSGLIAFSWTLRLKLEEPTTAP